MDVPGKALFYNDLTGILMVRATTEDLAIVQGAVEMLGGVANEQRPQAGPGVEGATSSAADLMRQRYGINRGAQTPPPAPAATVAAAPVPAAAPPSPAAIAAEIAKLSIVVLAQGTWKADADKYELALQAQVSSLPFEDGKKSATVGAEIRDGRLYLTAGEEIFVLEKF